MLSIRTGRSTRYNKWVTQQMFNDTKKSNHVSRVPVSGHSTNNVRCNGTVVKHGRHGHVSPFVPSLSRALCRLFLGWHWTKATLYRDPLVCRVFFSRTLSKSVYIQPVCREYTLLARTDFPSVTLEALQAILYMQTLTFEGL